MLDILIILLIKHWCITQYEHLIQYYVNKYMGPLLLLKNLRDAFSLVSGKKASGTANREFENSAAFISTELTEHVDQVEGWPDAYP